MGEVGATLGAGADDHGWRLVAHRCRHANATLIGIDGIRVTAGHPDASGRPCHDLHGRAVDEQAGPSDPQRRQVGETTA